MECAADNAWIRPSKEKMSMPTMARLFHNPRFSKSRGALELLHERGIAPEILPYLEQPPSIAELRDLVQLLGLPARNLLRTGEAEYSELGLDDPALGDDALLAPMHAHPRLIERPIFI